MKKLSFLLTALFAFTFSVACGAQGIITGTINGTVQDTTGALLPGASVTLTATATGIVTKAKTDGAGVFNLANLPIGDYKIAITSVGFDTLQVDHISVESGKVTGLGIEKLATGGAIETVEVNTSQNLLETSEAQVTTTFDSVQVSNLPTGGGFDELALLIPGVVSTHGNNRSNTNGAGISSNGSRGRSNNFEIDGQSNNDNSVTGPQIFFSNDEALQEVQIITDNFSAQYGRDAGSVVNYLTKSGTNQYHGSAIYRYEGAWLSSLTQGQKGPQFGYCMPGQTPAANACTAVVKPRFTDNQFGGTLGGPFLKDRLFGFGSAYFGRNFNGQTTSNSGTSTGTSGFLPTAAGLQALAAAYPNNPGVQSLLQYGPQAINLGTFQYILPANARTILVSDGTTSTSIPVQQYSRTINPHNTDEEVLGRLDYQATSRDRFFLRYFYQFSPSFLASGTVTTGGLVNVTDKDQSVGADWSHTFGPRAVNQLRYSFQQSTVNFDGGAFPNCTVTSISTCPSSFASSTSSAYRVGPGGLATTGVSISSFGLSTSYPQGRVVKDTQVQDNFNLTLGKHTIVLGGAYEFQNSPNVFLPNISGGFTIYGFDSLLGNAAVPQYLGLAIGSPNIHFTEPDVAAYANDNWKVTPELTINAGLRWEFFAQSINLLHNLTVAQQTGPNPLWSTALPLSQTTFPQIPQDYKHFEPRLGFAYSPNGLKGFVLRGGYAINIAPAYYNIFLNSYGTAPVVLANTITGCNNSTKLCIPTGGANYASVHALDNGYLAPAGGASTLNPGNFAQTLVQPNFAQPITQTFSLGIQQEIGRIGVGEVRYVGAHTSKDFQSLNGNPAIGAVVAAFPGYYSGVTPCTTAGTPGYSATNGRVNCAESIVRTRANTSFEVYNGLQTSFNTRAYHGLTANFSYTYSRTVDNASEIFSTNGAGTTNAFAQDPLNANIGERGVSGNSYPNVTGIGLVYKVPYFEHSHGLVGHALGGFQFNTIYVFNGGQPFTPFQLEEGSFCDNAFSTQYNGSVDNCRPVLANPAAPIGNVGVRLANGTYENVNVANTQGVLATAPRSSFHWVYDTQAEALALGTPYPGVPRNTLRGGSYNNMDASVFKNTVFHDHYTLRLELTVFNALNRAYYGAPDAEIEDAGSTFANFTGNGGSNRNVQIGGKFLF